MNVHFIFYVHLTELFSCWYNCCLFVDCFKVPCRIVDLLLGVKALREGEKLLRDGGGEIGFCGQAVSTVCWRLLLLFNFVGHLQLRRNPLMRQAMMHFSVVQVKCFSNTS